MKLHFVLERSCETRWTEQNYWVYVVWFFVSVAPQFEMQGLKGRVHKDEPGIDELGALRMAHRKSQSLDSGDHLRNQSRPSKAIWSGAFSGR